MAKNNQARDKSLTQGDVGYRRPPVGGQFKPGQSGNRKGRPRGRPNMATLIKALFNEPVAVREGGKVRRMPTGEAIFRSQVALAGGGDPRALFTVMDLLEMTGRTKDVSEEEREKRSLHLQNAFTAEEFDLLHSLAREKERERCRMIAESAPERYATSDNGVQAVVVPPAVQAGDSLAAQGKIDEALTAYRQELDACKRELDADSSDQAAQERFRRAVARIGLLADTLLFAGEFERAITLAEEALVEGATPYWVPKKLPFYEHFLLSSMDWIRVVRAHACMLSGRDDEAQKFYIQFNSNKRLAETSWETAVLRDFVCLRKAGHSHRLMDEIERRYRDEGWTTENMNTKIFQPTMKGEDSVFIQQNPDSLKSGDILRDFDKLDEAMAVYLRNLKKWKANLAKDPGRTEWKQNFSDAVERVALTTMQFFQRGRFATALEGMDEAATVAPEEFLLQALHACALMMIAGHSGEARTLFLRYRGETMGGKTWEAVVRDQFAALRKAGCERLLMGEIEKRFAGIAVPEIADEPTRKVADPISILIQASDLRSGEMLEERGILEEALTVYSRCLDTCVAKIGKFANGQFNTQAIEDREAAIDRLTNLTIRFLSDRNFEQARKAIDSALAVRPDAPTLNIYRAHALMFLDREHEAKELYLRYADEKVDGDQIGKQLILQDFDSMRSARLTHRLQEEIETCLQLTQVVETT